MTSSGAYEDEMRLFLKLSDEELARLLAGEAPVGKEAYEQVASLLNEVRTTFTAPPAAPTRARHIAATSEASRLLADKGDPAVRPVSKAHGPVESQVSGLSKWRKVMDRTVSLALKAVAGATAASVSMMGLAYAGVDLPGEAAQKAIEAVTGLELPNQGPPEGSGEEGKSVADDVRSVLDGDLEGCELGQAVADAADANRQDDAKTETDPCTKKDAHEAEGSKATGDEKSAAGRAKAAEKSGGHPESGSDASAGGRATAAEKSGGRSENGSANSSDGRATATEKSEGRSDSGKATGDEKSKEGQSNNPSGEDSGSGDEKSEEGQANNPTGQGSDSGTEAAAEGQSRSPVDRP